MNKKDLTKAAKKNKTCKYVDRLNRCNKKGEYIDNEFQIIYYCLECKEHERQGGENNANDKQVNSR